MALHVGCDIVSIGVFQNRLCETGDLLPELIFHPSEQINATPERLAGLFAAKEATFKALNMPAGAWQQLCIDHGSNGAPMIRLLEPQLLIHEITLSISHCDDYAFAVVAAVIE
ncbi:MAG: 4'-phosphopantetheinyl transferase superfamily protein [Methylococcales bacterium]|nr:4'-phosphopantetheinyl transferase superfamily protein [Methylococcales bacterium]MCK5478964.1 4'-phosphopantetheinyl transferase superfamily protein [Methylococcales bacterium]